MSSRLSSLVTPPQCDTGHAERGGRDGGGRLRPSWFVICDDQPKGLHGSTGELADPRDAVSVCDASGVPYTYAPTVAFVGSLVHANRVLMSVLQEHLEDNEGEVLPHVLMFGLRRWVERELVAHGETAAVLAIVETLQASLADDDYEVWALVHTSFLSDLSEPPHPAGRLARFFDASIRQPPRLRF